MRGPAPSHPHNAAQCSELPNAAFGTLLMAVPMTVKGDRMAVRNYVISQRIILRWGCCCLQP